MAGPSPRTGSRCSCPARAPKASPSGSPGSGGRWEQGRSPFLGVEAEVKARRVGQEDSAGTGGGAGYLPCQLTDVVTSLSLARCLVTARALPRTANHRFVS